MQNMAQAAWTGLDLSEMRYALYGNWKIPPTHFHTLGPKYSCPNNSFVKSRENCSQLTKKALHKGKVLFPSLKGRGESEFSLPWKVLNISAWQGSGASLGNRCVWGRRDPCRVVEAQQTMCAGHLEAAGSPSSWALMKTWFWEAKTRGCGTDSSAHIIISLRAFGRNVTFQGE